MSAEPSAFSPFAELPPASLRYPRSIVEGEELAAWSDSPVQLVFRESVLAAHIKRSAQRKGPAQRDLAPAELRMVPGTAIQMGTAAASAAGRLIEAANTALAAGRAAGDADALRTLRITATSGYRSRDKQDRIWRSYFKDYYNQTRAARQSLGGGAQSPAAIRYMLDAFNIPRRIAAPGYSNHQNGIAIDLKQKRTRGHPIRNSSRDVWRARWRRTWFFKWLQANAATFGFQPYSKEEWHWEYRPTAASREEEQPFNTLEAEEEDFSMEELDEALASDEGEELAGAEEAEDREDTEGEIYETDEAAQETEEFAADSAEALTDEGEEFAGAEEAEAEAEEEGEGEGAEESVQPTETEDEGLDSEQLEDFTASDPEEEEFATAEEGEGETVSGELDPAVARIAESVMARRAPSFELDVPKPRRARWTRCFKAAAVERLRKAYQANATAAAADSGQRAACIVMLNVGLGQLLPLKTKRWPARSTATRRVQMGDLTTQTIEAAMAQLEGRGHTAPVIKIQFLDRRNKIAGTLKPERLQSSVQARILKNTAVARCWFAFGLSILDGYHSVLLLVDRRTKPGKIYWLDQNSTGINDDVTTTLDARITERTQTWWQAVYDRKHVGYSTTVRLWPLRRRL